MSMYAHCLLFWTLALAQDAIKRVALTPRAGGAMLEGPDLKDERSEWSWRWRQRCKCLARKIP